MYKLSKNLQRDIIKIKGKKIFINPFLYSRKLDKNTKDWLRKIRQLSDSEIVQNRLRFYPEINWKNLTDDEKNILNATVEMFLKTLEIIKKFHPNLSLQELDMVEKKLIFFKKIDFEKWVKKQFNLKTKLILKEKRKLNRINLINNWNYWFSFKQTQQFLSIFFGIILLSTLLGWFAGISKNSCNPYFESGISISL